MRCERCSSVDIVTLCESNTFSSYDLTQSPFVSIIQTNYNPSREDIVHLEAHLVEPQLRLSRLESEIAQLNDLLQTFSMKRDLLKRYIEAHRALMSPIRRLPVETLSEIFMHCLPEDRYAVRDLSEAPLLLTGISQQWRQTAIGTPALWKSLHIHLPWGISAQSVEQRTVGSSLWLKRSGMLPLSISLSMETTSSRQRHRITGPAMECIDLFVAKILLAYSNRIKELFFSGSTCFHLATHLDQLASHFFPILKVFHVCHTGISRRRVTEEPAIPFASLVQQMPALNNLKALGFSHSGQEFVQLKLGWEKLTELELSPSLTGRSIVARFSSQDFLGLLRHACRLQSLTVSVDISTWSNDMTMLNLPAMRNMRLTICYVQVGQQQQALQARTCLQNFYRSLVCPSLRTLHASWPGIHLKEMPFLLASLVELDTLSLDMPLTTSTLIESLRFFPNLRFLEVIGRAIKVDDGDPSQGVLPSLVHTVDDTLLQSLNPVTSEGGHTLCSNLQHIRVIYKDSLHSSISNDALLTLLENRVQTKILQSCDVFFAQPRAESTEDENQ